jgi:hypothetical protein
MFPLNSSAMTEERPIRILTERTIATIWDSTPAVAAAQWGLAAMDMQKLAARAESD